jgi:hypothetical protein
MRIFDHPNLDQKIWKCPICKTREDLPVTLIGLAYQKQTAIKAVQVHINCIDLVLLPLDNKQALVMFLEEKQNFNLSELI